MSLAFFPRSRVTTTSAFEQDTTQVDGGDDGERNFRERKFRCRRSCREGDDEVERERGTGDKFISFLFQDCNVLAWSRFVTAVSIYHYLCSYSILLL